ncbi:MAG TPA: SDR family oxidoreductase [Terriglobales bacterium]|nr:SDR family oxidoreductase [Terriglobales bacterium]
MQELAGKVVVITGASSGFGRGAAMKFAGAGANVVAASRRKRVLKELERQCKDLEGRIVVVETDVSQQKDVEKLCSKALSEFGRIDIWINNAGVGTVGHFEEVPLQEHEQVIRTNLLGTVYGSYFALREFRQRGKGILINMSSFAGKIGSPYLSSYSASKFGVRGLDMALRQELEQNDEVGIHVCTVMPASFDTPFFEHSGSHLGKEVQPIPPVYDPQKVINTIFELAQDPRDEVAVGTMGKVGSAQYRLAPKLTEKIMGKNTHRSQMKAASARNSSGSVFEPMSSGTDVYGGWRESNGVAKTAAKVLGIAAPAALAVVLLARKRWQDDRELSRVA